MVYRILFAAFLFQFMGCNNFSSLEDIELPKHKAKLVVFANLESDQFGFSNSEYIYIYKTRSALDTSTRSVVQTDSLFQDSLWRVFATFGLDTVNATVELFRNGVLFATFERLQFGSFNRYWFTGRKRMQADGATYLLRVSATGFETAEAMQIMPPLIKLDSAKWVRKGLVFTDLYYYPNAYEFVCLFKDSAAMPNYYRAGQSAGHRIPNSRLFNLDASTNSDVLSDYNFEGKPFAWRVFYPNIFNNQLEGKGGLMIELYSTTREAFLFEQSSNRYFATKDNRFAEPTTLYSNIKNGYGLFTLSAVSEFYLKF